MTSPLALYGAILDGRHEDEVPVARMLDGTVRPALVARWRGAADPVDERVLDRLEGPVLDVGCGPGRHLSALTRRGVFGLGVDLSPAAVRLARGAGAHAIVGSIFHDLPGTGQWGSALLLDGNIGIGGSPRRLLTRVAALLRPRGRVAVELAAPDRPSVETMVRLETGTAVSEWFPWAEVSVADVDRIAASAEMTVVGRWRDEDRWFALLVNG